MNDARRKALVLRFANLMMAQRDTLNGLTIFMGEGMLTTKELCEIGRQALTLIEEGKI